MSPRMIETLESRALMSATPLPTVALVGGVLTITGTDAADTVVVGLASDQKNVLVRLSSGAASKTVTFPKAYVWAAAIDGRGGDDLLMVDEAYGKFVPTMMIGGAGNDVLCGGSSSDVLVGDNLLDPTHGGDDILSGGGGDDFLFGGAGNDILQGGAGDDYLDGGSGSNILIGDDGKNHVKASSATDLVIATANDVLDCVAGATVLC